MTDATTNDAPKSDIVITESAQEYLATLLQKQDDTPAGVRIFVEHAGTPRAECCMSYCYSDDICDDDVVIEYAKFSAYLEGKSVPYLAEATVDYNKDRFGGQLTFRAPNAKVPKVGKDASIEERVNYVLQADINPALASHGGNVSLVRVVDDAAGLTAVLRFGGGCQGCSAADITLREGVEVQLKQQIPEIMHIVDETDHSQNEHAYYQ